MLQFKISSPALGMCPAGDEKPMPENTSWTVLC